jgi:replicative DNA helicase
MGKTAAAISYALGAARAGHGVLFVSLEMSAVELSSRIAADLAFNGRSGIAFSDINSDRPSRDALRAMGNAAAELAEMPFHIVDAGSLTLGRLDMIVRRYKRRLAARGQSLDLVVVDYLQLLRCDERRTSAYETVSEVSRRLKGMAKDHDVAVFALAQLSREVEKRADKRPQLADLRDSGQIEQDADAVLFLYRHEYYLAAGKPEEGAPEYQEWKQAIDAVRGCIDFICAKRRNGITGSARGLFHGQFQAVRG